MLSDAECSFGYAKIQIKNRMSTKKGEKLAVSLPICSL